MRICIALVFFCAVLMQAYRAEAVASPTLRVVFDSTDAHADFREALLTRLHARVGWSTEVGGVLPNRPCVASGPRAGLVVHFRQTSNTSLVADVALVDCAAWPVKDWSYTRPATIIGERALAGDVLFGFRLWQHAEPSRFAALFDTGDANARSHACRNEFSLVKTSDGQMRSIVRAGGPAYQAGFRSNDAILRIDGRDWWEYGTYQSQQRALDGKTHTYTLSNSLREITLACPDQ